MSRFPIALAAAMMVAATSARADVTYVDATTSNTTPNGFSDANGTALYPDTSYYLWKFRTGFGTSLGNAGIFESGGSTSTRHNDIELTTTFTVPVAGTYRIYVFYLAHPTATDNNWNIRAGLTSNPGANQIFDEYATAGAGAIAGTNASGLTFTTGANPVSTNQEATYPHYYGVVGEVTVAAGGSVSVYVDDLYPTVVTRRSMYDGVGYELIGPAATDFDLSITPNAGTPGNYDFAWDSQDGKYYKLVSASDLSSPVAEWPTWEGHVNIAGTAPTNTLTNVPGGGDGKRFFAVVQTDAPEPEP